MQREMHFDIGIINRPGLGNIQNVKEFQTDANIRHKKTVSFLIQC